MKRDNINKKQILPISEEVKLAWISRLKKHGDGLFVSSHETLGIITEELKELIDDVHANKPIEDELMDLAIACLHGIASERKNIETKEGEKNV